MAILRTLGYVLLAVFFQFAGAVATAQELQPVPALTARVIDRTGTLTADQLGRLQTKLALLEGQKGVQFAVLIVPSVAPESVEQFALRVVERWKIGRKGVDDGALLLVAKADRRLRIEVGYGLEGALNDATAKRIISETIGPRFQQGDFYGGIDAGLDAMIRVAAGESLPPPQKVGRSPAQGIDVESLLPLGFLLVFVVGGILRAIFGRFLAACMVGGVAGFAAVMVLQSVLLAVAIGAIAFVFSLFSGVRGGGGGFSGGSSWGGGGGGFSGGGGGFGGGGASGRW